MAQTSNNLSAKQHAAIDALLTSTTVQTAAEIAGVSRRQLYRWLDDPDFADVYRRARWSATQHTIARLQQVSHHAVTVLISIAADKHQPASSRVAAASKLLDLTLRATEIERLDERLTNLEALLKEKHG